MSILSALKAKGAKGKNIEEAVKTLPMGGGGSDGGVFYADISATGPQSINPSVKCWDYYTDIVLDKTYSEMAAAIDEGKEVILRFTAAGSLGSPYHLHMYQDSRTDSEYDFVVFNCAKYDPFPADNTKIMVQIHQFVIYKNGEIDGKVFVKQY